MLYVLYSKKEDKILLHGIFTEDNIRKIKRPSYISCFIIPENRFLLEGMKL